MVGLSSVFLRRGAALTIVVVEAVLFDVLKSGSLPETLTVLVIVPVLIGVTTIDIVTLLLFATVPKLQVTILFA